MAYTATSSFVAGLLKSSFKVSVACVQSWSRGRRCFFRGHTAPSPRYEDHASNSKNNNYRHCAAPRRRYEPPLERAEVALDLLVTEMIKCMDKPFAFFGREVGSQACALPLALPCCAPVPELRLLLQLKVLPSAPIDLQIKLRYCLLECIVSGQTALPPMCRFIEIRTEK